MKLLKSIQSLSDGQKKLIADAQERINEILALPKNQQATFLLHDEKMQVIATVKMKDCSQKTLRDLITQIVKKLKDRVPQMYSITINIAVFPNHGNKAKPLLGLDNAQLDLPLRFLFGCSPFDHILIAKDTAITPQQNLLLDHKKTVSFQNNPIENAARCHLILSELAEEQPNEEQIKNLMQGITHLDLARCFLENYFIQKVGVAAMAKILKTNHSLVWLILPLFKLEQDSAQEIAHALKINKTLTSLAIIGCDFDQNSLRILDEALDENTTLLDLNCVFPKSPAEPFKLSVEYKLQRNRLQPAYLDFIQLCLIEANILKGISVLYVLTVAYLTLDSESVLSFDAVRAGQKDRNVRLLQWLPTARLSIPVPGDILKTASLKAFIQQSKNYEYDDNIMQLTFRDVAQDRVALLARSFNTLFSEKGRQNCHKAYIHADGPLVLRGISPPELRRII